MMLEEDWDSLETAISDLMAEYPPLYEVLEDDLHDLVFKFVRALSRKYSQLSSEQDDEE